MGKHRNSAAHNLDCAPVSGVSKTLPMTCRLSRALNASGACSKGNLQPAEYSNNHTCQRFNHYSFQLCISGSDMLLRMRMVLQQRRNYATAYARLLHDSACQAEISQQHIRDTAACMSRHALVHGVPRLTCER